MVPNWCCDVTVGTGLDHLSKKHYSVHYSNKFFTKANDAKRHAIKNMPNRCVVAGCSNVASTKTGISLHFIPFSDDQRPEAKKDANIGLILCAQKRAKWDPTPNSSICLAHFSKDDFAEIFSFSGKVRRLVSDEIGVVAIPKHANTSVEDLPSTARAKRAVSIISVCVFHVLIPQLNFT